ncbi:MAG: hypothetical protein NT105_07735 [Verrucomicrobia bacterium]|nr:hypothetical protein [Verrucomicrobiota bacterium]
MSVAIIDDDPSAAKVTRMAVEDAGLQPWLIARDPKLQRCSKQHAMKVIAQNILRTADAAVCDHRLRPHGFAKFDGAELVAFLISNSLPAILISQFVDQDYDVSIRHWRAKLPSVLSRDEFRADTFAEGLEMCRREIRGELTPQRRGHRVLIRIVDIQNEASQRVVDAIIPAWSRKTAVRFPFAIVPSRLHARLKTNSYLIARVNLGANRPEDLFFDKFEKPPTPKNALFNHF